MDEHSINILINNIKSKRVSCTSYGNSEYSPLWYTDDTNKICVTFTPRGGCSISFQQYLDMVGLLSDGFQYNAFIHCYRCELFLPNISYKSLETLIAEKYTFIKFIMNPYIRAVSVYISQTSHNLSFRAYLRQLVTNEIDYFSDTDKYHLQPQYIEGEEHIITKYVKINENDKCTITLHDNTLYELDVNKYTSVHHSNKTTHTDFCGDISRDIVIKNLPKSYKYFYDDKIKCLVDNFYKTDVEKYGFRFDNF